MFHITAYTNPYLRLEQNSMQAVLSLNVDADLPIAPAPLALAIALDHSGSMEGPKMRAARDGAIKVVQALDEQMLLLVVIFNENARVVFGPVLANDENKRRAILQLQMVHAMGGTRMSNALNAIVENLGQQRNYVTKVLFLTDGRNEGEQRQQLNQAIERCQRAQMSISAWGVGTDWDAAELRAMADSTHGTADIIPSPNQVGPTFIAAFREMRRTALTQTRLQLWTPNGVKVQRIQQVFPNLVPLGLEQDPANPRQVIIGLGSFAAGAQYEYLVDLTVPIYAPGQQFLMLRPSVKYLVGGRDEAEEKSERSGWVFVQWTEDHALAARIEQHIAHYTNQEELAQAIKAGQEALAQGDREKATRLLGQALAISERTRNEHITRLLSTIVLRDANGTVHLNAQADAVARKTLAINVGRTSRLN
jgi:Ca-activated chloride channel homolog